MDVWILYAGLIGMVVAVLAVWSSALDPLKDFSAIPEYEKSGKENAVNISTFADQNETGVLASLDETKKPLFVAEINARRKKTSTGLILTLFFGGLGVHHFYFDNVLVGILYLLFCWTFIPALFALIELLFCIPTYVRDYNDRLAQEIGVKLMHGAS